MTLADDPNPSRWEGRLVKVGGVPGAPHPVRARMIRIASKKKVIVQPFGHRMTTTVKPSEVILWWSENPDLKEEEEA